MEAGSETRHKRTGVACEQCRLRKRKCDGVRPSCTLCKTLRKECEYSGLTESRKRKPPDVEHVAMLENQIANLKSYVRQLEQITSTSLPLPRNSHEQDVAQSSAEPSFESLDGSEDEHSTEENAPQVERDSEAAATGLSASAVEEVAALIWKMNIGDAGEPAFTGPSGNFCFPSSSIRSVNAESSIDHSKPITTRPFRDDSLFSNDVALKHSLISLFMTHINPIHQFVQSSTVLIAENYPTQKTTLNLLYCAVFSAGACFAEEVYVKQAGDSFAAHADTIALQSCRSQPSIFGIQALSILAWRELTQERHNIAWIYNSMAGGLALGLGLHVIGLQALSDPSYAPLQEERETRIRTFWAFFLFDRMATSILGRNCTVPWRRVDVPNMNTILGPDASIDDLSFSYQCQLWFLHDQYMDQIYAFEFNDLEFVQRNRLLLAARSAIFDYRQSLPAPLRVSLAPKAAFEPPQASVLFLQMSYEMSLLLIHRPFLREPPNTKSFHLAIITMTLAASNMTRYIQIFQKTYGKNSLPQTQQTRSEQLVPPHFLIHHVLTASIMHLLNGTSSEVQHKNRVRRKLQVCMDFLADLQVSWIGAGKAMTQIQELAFRWRVVGVLPMRFSNVSLLKKMKQNPPREEDAEGQSAVGQSINDYPGNSVLEMSADSYNFVAARDDVVTSTALLDNGFDMSYIQNDFDFDFDYDALNLPTELNSVSQVGSADDIAANSWHVPLDVDENALHDIFGINSLYGECL
ncbi:hypothetical protein L207DRAFT_498539 [Hyaloscypha variabilis F]|uniref:Zn(2)-C6 fungal-type domain-containing protein n=1 Tax=Hyaloscypha variabilis (strain UAMH 11265 / GT02V1 / F) TaxID=1149755 RepID=A0A2J6R619_HYAVF|nr:hypothetical protein L207DRAFT_498539 [Hyaloscypha variabilis F]